MAVAAFPLLIAHTPRAGRWNHIALLPPAELPAGTDVAAYLSVAASNGNNYVAATAEVMQPTTGRTGQEVLALIGVAIPEAGRLAALETWLRARLGELGAAVAAFDWEAHTGGPACIPILAEWRDRAVSEFGLTPHRTQTLTPRSPASELATSQARRSVLAMAVVGASLLAAGLLRKYGLLGGP